MAEIPQSADVPLTDDELRSLARRHERLLKKYRFRREQERARREQQALAYAWARQMAAESVVASRRSADLAAPPAPALISERDRSRAEALRKKITESHVAPEAPNRYPSPDENFVGMHFEEKPISPFMRWVRVIGGGSLAFSILFHFALIIIALFWVVTVYVKPPEEPPSFFATGSGGGRGGERPSYADVKSKRRSAGKLGITAPSYKIVSKSRMAALTLPDVSLSSVNTPLSGAFASSGALRNIGGDLSSGLGGGLGGGLGTGLGVGIGNTRNYVGKFKTTQKILGTNVTAERLAVYMDSSGSMTDVIPVVRKEILKKFPTADVYDFMGCGMGRIQTRTRTEAVEKMWTREKNRLLALYDREKKSANAKSAKKRFVNKSSKKRSLLLGDVQDEWKDHLSSYGKRLLEVWGNQSFTGLDMGSWLEMCFAEGGYDAVIVFADFQDYRDGFLANEKALLERWLAAAQRNRQRVYFFTTEMMPATIFQALSAYTGGEIALPKEISKGSQSSRETEKLLKQLEREKKKNKPELLDLSSDEESVPVDESVLDEESESVEEEEDFLFLDEPPAD